MMNNTILETNFNFQNQTSFYKGKIRDVYTINNDILVMIAMTEYQHLILFCLRHSF